MRSLASLLVALTFVASTTSAADKDVKGQKRNPAQTPSISCRQAMDDAMKKVGGKFKYESTSITPIGAEGFAQVTSYASVYFEQGAPFFYLVSATCKPNSTGYFFLESMVLHEDTEFKEGGVFTKKLVMMRM